MYAALPVAGLLLAGCSTLSAINPVNWWHDMEGGKIAEQRPPPPGANDPSPNLGNMPVRPAAPDREAMKRLTQALVADRENARYTNAANPLLDPSSPSASPSLFGRGTLPPPAPPVPPGASASLAAASAPPAGPPPAPSSAPIRPVEASPLTAPVAAPSALAPLPAPSAAPPPPPAVAALPPLPAAPPPRAASAPIAPPAAAAAPVAATPVAGNTTILAFDPGSAALLPATAEAIRQVASRRGSQQIALTGYGDAIHSDAAAQEAGVRLAMTRAMAVASALKAAGVPEAVIQLGGEAAGRGVNIRLLQ